MLDQQQPQMETLARLLCETVDPARRVSAEKALDQLQQDDPSSFSLLLLQLLSTQQQQQQASSSSSVVVFAGSLLFKNFIARHWPVRTTHCLTILHVCVCL